LIQLLSFADATPYAARCHALPVADAIAFSPFSLLLLRYYAMLRVTLMIMPPLR